MGKERGLLITTCRASHAHSLRTRHARKTHFVRTTCADIRSSSIENTPPSAHQMLRFSEYAYVDKGHVRVLCLSVHILYPFPITK